MISLDARATAADARAAAAALSEDEARALLYDWEFWARPEQLMPEGGWRTWLVMAGRGFGKTRTGVEAVRQVARDPRAVMALIGPTAADARQVIIEGESGLLAVCADGERPVYRPSIRELRWPNGAKAFTYSAEEPERLRGPQHSFAYCLIGETRVLMANGSEKPLREIRVGDIVRTRRGARRVIAHALTRRNAELFRLLTVDGRDIIGTSDHPVWVLGRGFLPLTDVRPGMSVCVNTASNGTVTSGTAITVPSTGVEKCAYTARFGSRFTGASPMDIRSIMSTAIPPTIELKTWNCSRTASTAASTCRTRFRWKAGRVVFRRPLPRWHGSGEKISNLSGAVSFAAHRISALVFSPALTVPVNAWMRFDPVDSPAKTDYVPAVGHLLPQPSGLNCIVPRNAIRARSQIEPRAARHGSSSVPVAGWDFPVCEATQDFAVGNAPSSSTQPCLCAGSEKLATCADVFDITVEMDGEFFANGILVHNCDEIAVWPEPKLLWDNLKFGLRLGTDPRIVATTTPRPSGFLRELLRDPGTRISRGSTFDNRANLPDAALAEYERVYGGTRIGRQELEGELLEEAEGALWRRAQIDALRVREAPELVRIVIAIDPNVSGGPDADECGIVACGLGTNGHGYVLRDLSCALPPDQWAARAVSGFDALEADKVIAETNNGGDLVTMVLRTVRPNLPFEKVHASRGKVARAEPVAALYEQGKIHHVGGFKELEDEQANFVPGALTKSPNRVDALVWGFSFLMLKPVRVGRVLGV